MKRTSIFILLQLLLTAVAISGNPLDSPIPNKAVDYNINCYNTAAFIGKFRVRYTLNGKQVMPSSPDLPAGQTYKFTIPVSATGIIVEGGYVSLCETGTCFEVTFVDRLDQAKNACYKLYGSVVSSQWNRDCVEATANQIKFTHGAGFVANWQITYNQPGKPATNINPTGTTLGWKNTYTIPSDATNIRILVQGATGLIWEPWRTTYDKTFPTPPAAGLCIKIYGTTLDQKWNSDCN